MKVSDFNLAEFQFVAGNQARFRFSCYRETDDGGKEILDLSNATVIISLINYQHQNSTPDLSKECEIHQGSSGEYNIIYVQLMPEETVNLYGKYIYQLTAIDNENKITEIPGQGIIYIVKNQDPTLIQ